MVASASENMLMKQVDELSENVVMQLGWVWSDNGHQHLTPPARLMKEMWSTLLEFAKDLQVQVDGGFVGRGAAYIPPVKGSEGASLLIYWRTDVPTSFLFRELRSHWGIRLSGYGKELLLNPGDSISFIMLYKQGVTTLFPDSWYGLRVPETTYQPTPTAITPTPKAPSPYPSLPPLPIPSAPPRTFTVAPGASSTSGSTYAPTSWLVEMRTLEIY